MKLFFHYIPYLYLQLVHSFQFLNFEKINGNKNPLRVKVVSFMLSFNFICLMVLMIWSNVLMPGKLHLLMSPNCLVLNCVGVFFSDILLFLILVLLKLILISSQMFFSLFRHTFSMGQLVFYLPAWKNIEAFIRVR